jgi:hypothetical protein
LAEREAQPTGRQAAVVRLLVSQAGRVGCSPVGQRIFEDSSPRPPLTGDITGLVAAPLTPVPNGGKGKSRGHKQTLTIENVGGQPLGGPLNVVLRGLKRTVKLHGASGFVGRKGKRNPFVRIDLARKVLQPGDSASIVLQFSGKPNRFTVIVYADSSPT